VGRWPSQPTKSKRGRIKMKGAFKGTEIIVGIPSYMEADAISFVTKQADKGLQKYFKKMHPLILNMDNNSEDDTKTVFLSTETQTPKHYISTPKGVRGKGNNFRNLFKFAGNLQDSLRAVVVVDGDLRSIKPEWIKHLAEPILKGYDYALPLYSRHQFDGSITNHICYPLLYGLLGEDLRQPIGGEFAFSPELIDYWLKQKWIKTTRQYGIDIFMTLNAILGKFRICEIGLGAKIHKASAPKLGPMFTQVVTTLFDYIISNKGMWLATPIVKPKAKKRFGLKRLSPPQELDIDIRALKESLRTAFSQRERLIKKHLNEYAVMNLGNMFLQDYYNIDTLMWTQEVYQLLFTYDMGSARVKKDIIEALKPLYFARSVTFDYLTWRYNIKYAEEAIIAQAKAFASQKPYLIGLYLNEELKKRA
jgi:glycosyltransferase involved in cell wall biosynthesis